MKTKLLYLNYHKQDNLDNNITKFIHLLEKNFGKNQVVSFNSQQINNCNVYSVIFTKNFLDKLDQTFFFENLLAIKNNKIIILPLIVKPNNDEKEYQEKLNYFINKFNEEHIEYIQMNNINFLSNYLDQIKEIIHHNYDNNLFYLDYLKGLKKTCLPSSQQSQINNQIENLYDLQIKLNLIRHPLDKEMDDEELSNEIIYNQDDFILNLFEEIFNEKEKAIELTSIPGSGKTTLIKKLILDLISRLNYTSDNVFEEDEQIAPIMSSNFFPVYIHVPSFITYLIDNSHIEEALCAYLKVANYTLYYLIHHKKVIFFFDGIDFAGKDEIDHITSFVEEYFIKNEHYVFYTSNNPTTNYRKYSLKPLNFEQKETLIDHLIKDKKHDFKIDDLPNNPFDFCLDLSLYQLQDQYQLNNYIFQKSFDSINEIIKILTKANFFKDDNNQKTTLTDSENIALIGKYFYQENIHKVKNLYNYNSINKLSPKFKDLNVFEYFKKNFLAFQRIVDNSEEIKDYLIGYYLYDEINKNHKQVEKFYQLLDNFVDHNYISNTHFYPIKMLLLLLDAHKEGNYVTHILEYLQLKVIPNYDMITESINAFTNDEIKKLAVEHIMKTMLDRGCEGIVTGSIGDKGLYTFTNGANPYEELFYYLAKNPSYYAVFSKVNRDEDNIKEYLYQEALDIFGIKLEIKFFQYEKYIDVDTSKKLKYAKSIKRKENYLDIRGHIGIFEKNLEGFTALDSRNITSLYIYPGVEELGSGILFNLENLTNIRCDHRNKRYYSELQCLIERGTRQLIIGCQNSTIPGNVVSIAQKAWWGSRNLTKLIIPFNVLDIGPKAFSQCTSLETITLGSSLKSISEDCFRGCSSLKNINLPNGLKTIGAKAFYGCISLKSIYIPKSIDNIGSQAFTNCPNLNIFNVDKLNKVYLTDKNFLIMKETNYLTQAFNETYIPNKIKGIEALAYNNSKIFKVNLTPDIKQLKANAFYHCTEIQEITISKSVINIEPLAFNNSLNMVKTINVDRRNKVYLASGNAVILKKEKALVIGCSTTKIPDAVETIKEGALTGIDNIKEIFIPKKVIEIEDNAISYLKNLMIISVDKDNPNYYSSFNTLIDKRRNRLILGCKNSIIPDEVEIIGQNAFAGCEDLENLNLPDNLEKIEKYAFYHCKKLKWLIIPDKTKSIAKSALEDCLNLEEITIPTSIKSIEWYAFNHCPNLKIINYTGTKAQFEEIRIGSHNDVFNNIPINYNYIVDK